MTTEQKPTHGADEALPSQLRSGGLRGRMLHHTFENFETQHHEQVDVLLAARSYAENFRANAGGGLWLFGPPGTGKTHLGCAIARHIERVHRQRCCVFGVREIIRMLRMHWGPVEASPDIAEPVSSEAVIQHLGNAALLVLDGVGASFNSEAEAVQLFDIVELRYQQCRPTVVISNLLPSETKSVLGARSYDRLREGAKVLTCNWPSARSVNRAPGAEGER